MPKKPLPPGVSLPFHIQSLCGAVPSRVLLPVVQLAGEVLNAAPTVCLLIGNNHAARNLVTSLLNIVFLFILTAVFNRRIGALGPPRSGIQFLAAWKAVGALYSVAGGYAGGCWLRADGVIYDGGHS